MRRRFREFVDVFELSEEEQPAAPDPEDLESLEEFHALLRQLSTREAEVVRLLHTTGTSMRQAARVLGISDSSIKTHYYRALEKLRTVLSMRERGERAPPARTVLARRRAREPDP